MSYVLLKFNKELSDDNNACGFVAISVKEWTSYQELIKQYLTKPFEWFLGQYSLIEFKSAQEYLDSFEVSEISSQEYKTLLTHFEFLHQENWNKETSKWMKETTMVKLGNFPWFYNEKGIKDFVEHSY